MQERYNAGGRSNNNKKTKKRESPRKKKSALCQTIISRVQEVYTQIENAAMSAGTHTENAARDRPHGALCRTRGEAELKACVGWTAVEAAGDVGDTVDVESLR